MKKHSKFHNLKTQFILLPNQCLLDILVLFIFYYVDYAEISFPYNSLLLLLNHFLIHHFPSHFHHFHLLSIIYNLDCLINFHKNPNLLQLNLFRSDYLDHLTIFQKVFLLHYLLIHDLLFLIQNILAYQNYNFSIRSNFLSLVLLM